MSEEDKGNQPDDEELIDALADLLEQEELGGTQNLDAILNAHPKDRERLLKAIDVARGFSEIERLPSSSDYGAMQGTELGERYLLETPIGAGAMGEVYLAQDQRLERSVAVKLLRDSIWNSTEAEGRFEREARALAAIRHHAVVSVYDRGRSESGRQYLVMELLLGVGLHEILEAAASEPPETKDRVLSATRRLLGSDAALESNDTRQIAVWIRDAALGLNAVHENGLVHRDLKPSNIFIRTDGTAVILDFGIVSEGADRTLALDKTSLGTPAYMAPETVRPGGQASVVSDVYSLGATLYHSITLRLPYEGSPSGVLHALSRRAPPPIEQTRSSVHRDFRAITEKAMSRIGRRRYPDALALAADLEAFLEHSPVGARASTKTSRLARRLAASREVRTLVAALVILGGTLLVLDRIEADRIRRENELSMTLRRIAPSHLTSPRGPGRMSSEDVYSATEVAFADALATEVHPDLVRCYRAFSRAAQNRYPEARQDFEALHRNLGDPAFESLAEWVSRADFVPELPEAPSTSTTGTIARALFELKAAHGEEELQRIDNAWIALQSDNLADLPLVQDLRLMITGVRMDRRYRARVLEQDLRTVNQSLAEEALRLEVQLESPTPAIALCRANYFVTVDRPDLALSYCDRALEQCPTSASLQITRARALEELGRTSESIEALGVARSMSPSRTEIWRRYVRALASDFRFEDAYEALDEESPTTERTRAELRPELRAYVAWYQTAELALGGEEEAASRLAQAALEEWLRAAPRTVNQLEGSSKLLEAVLKTAAQGEFDGMIFTLRNELVRSPLSLTRLRNFLRFLPNGGQISVGSIRPVLQALENRLSQNHETDQ